jgi:hypothetical protein
MVSLLIEALSTLLPKADAQGLEPGTPSAELGFGSFVRINRYDLERTNSGIGFFYRLILSSGQ